MFNEARCVFKIFWKIRVYSRRQNSEGFLEIGITVYPCSDMFLLSLRRDKSIVLRRDMTLS